MRVFNIPIAVAIAGVILCGPSLAWSQFTPEIPALSQEQVDELNRGEIIVELQERQVPIGDALGVIDAPPERVMELLSVIDNHDEIFPDTMVSEVVGRDGEYILQHGMTDTVAHDGPRVTVRVWQGPMEIDGVPVLVHTWDYVPGSGNLADTHGYYLLIPWGESGDQTLLRYHLSADLGTWIPAFLLEWSTENMLPNQIEALRAAVAGVPGS
jgi:hypothetical protein